MTGSPTTEPSASTMEILVVAHSGYALERGRHLLADRRGVIFCGAGGGWRGVLRAITALLRARKARVVYCIDVGLSTTTAALLARLLRRRVVVDTGDAAFLLARSIGKRSWLGRTTVWLGE